MEMIFILVQPIVFVEVKLFLARVELVKISVKAYIPRHSEFGGVFCTYDPRGIPT